MPPKLPELVKRARRLATERDRLVQELAREWSRALKGQGFSAKGPHGDRKIVVRENTAFPELAKAFKATPIAVWRDFLTIKKALSG